MPKLWNSTIEEHRREVRDAILDTTATLVGSQGLRSVTMAKIAEKTGIGRATLYKYFPDIEAILHAWHGQQITHHLEQLAHARDQAASPDRRLEAVLETYALNILERGQHDSEHAALLHRDKQVVRARQQLREMIRDLIADDVKRGNVRDDTTPDELASYCLHALAAVSSANSKAAARRLVTIILAGLRAPR